MNDPVETTLADVRLMARERPKGYYEDVVARGTVEGEKITFTAEVWIQLVEKYQQPELPALSGMAKNFLGSMRKWVAAGLPIASGEQFRARLATCQPCEYWRGDKLVARCAVCGCAGIKLWMATEQCPKGKWGSMAGSLQRQSNASAALGRDT